ncbi:MAG: ABC transporter ATP-binding protein, partial [Bacteroidia bacterium]|nr:ABC transporter ATP-binding protein [Bacteroidia bacterium]
VTQGVISGNFDFLEKHPLLQKIIVSVQGWHGFWGLRTDVIILIGLIFFAMFAKNTFNYLSMLAAARQMVRFSNDLRKVIFSRYLQFGVGYFHKKSIGHLHQVLVTFVQMLGKEFTEVQQCVYQGSTLLIYLGIMFWISQSMTLFTVIAFPLLYLALHSLIQKLKRSSSSYSKQFMDLSKKIANSLSCTPLVKACSSETQELKWFCFASNRVADCEFRVEKKRLLVQPLQEVILLIVILILVAVMAFISSVSPAENRVAGFLVFFVVLRRAAYSFGVFNRIQAALAVMKGPLGEIEEVLDDDEKYYVASGEKKFTAFKEGFEIQGLNFSFSADIREILSDVCLKIPKGKSLALVGPTGSG